MMQQEKRHLSNQVRTCENCSAFLSPPPVAGREGRRVQQRLRRRLMTVVSRFGLIEKGDRLLVALSGGKDSFSLAELLLWLKTRRGGFDLMAVHVDPGFGSDCARRIAEWCSRRGLECHIEKTVIERLLREKLDPRKSYCSLCSRLRRGVLYGLLDRLGYNKLALGHHADDLIETLWLNLLFTGQIKSMPPFLRTDDGRHVVIRPLALAWEDDTRLYARYLGFPVSCCRCPACGERDNLQRRRVKAWLAEREAERPGTKKRLLKALGRVEEEELLDTRLWPAKEGKPAA
jgi:tRNA 2-thiocytidine biosynthesis protein TtcA